MFVEAADEALVHYVREVLPSASIKRFITFYRRLAVADVPGRQGTGHDFFSSTFSTFPLLAACSACLPIAPDIPFLSRTVVSLGRI